MKKKFLHIIHTYLHCTCTFIVANRRGALIQSSMCILNIYTYLLLFMYLWISACSLNRTDDICLAFSLSYVYVLFFFSFFLIYLCFALYVRTFFFPKLRTKTTTTTTTAAASAAMPQLCMYLYIPTEKYSAFIAARKSYVFVMYWEMVHGYVR